MKNAIKKLKWKVFVLLISVVTLAFLIIPASHPDLWAKSKTFQGKANTSPELLSQLAKEVLNDVAKIRGFKPKTSIETKLSSRAEIEEFVMDRFKKETTSAKLLASQKSLAKFGLIPMDMNLEKYLIQLYTDQIGGYYDQYKKILYLANWIPAEIQKPVMAHELMHVLQDQYFDLTGIINPLKDTNDAHMAKMALVEGEATAIMMEYMLSPQGISLSVFPDLRTLLQGEMQGLLTQMQSSKLGHLPNVIRENLLFPYIYGLSFIQAVRKNSTWERVADVYRDLPTSTRQIMHPEVYLERRENPKNIELTLPMIKDFVGADWKEVDRDVLGEFNTYVLLKEFVEEEEAVKSSEGWAGDRYLLIENQATGSLALMFLTVWNDDNHAEKFYKSEKKIMDKKYEDKRPFYDFQPSEKTQAWISQKGGGIWLQRAENRVLTIEGLPENNLSSLSKKILSLN